MAGNLTLEALQEDAALGQIDTVISCIPDMQGRLMGKRFHVSAFLDSALSESHCCNYLLATDMEMRTVPGYRSTSWEAGYGDYAMVPDLTTLRRLPWLEGSALVLCDLVDPVSHAPIPFAPRAILKQQIARAAALGLAPVMATELEFYLFEQSYAALRDAQFRDPRPMSSYNIDYSVFATTKEEEVMRAIRNGLFDAGIAIECSKGEAEIGQQELNTKYGPALDIADGHVFIKNAVKEIAFAKGRSVSFMAKYHHERAGSSSHIHQSLWQGEQAAFHDPAAPQGMSKLMQHYLAGQLAHAAEITALLAPYVNSYKRFVAGTFAPTSPVWSHDNRTAGFRICGAGGPGLRVECRIGGADLNPYLAMAGLLAAGLAGIEAELPLGPESRGDAYATDT
ncbi:glutamine synthetase, partial [Thioclava sp. BHET1]